MSNQDENKKARTQVAELKAFSLSSKTFSRYQTVISNFV